MNLALIGAGVTIIAGIVLKVIFGKKTQSKEDAQLQVQAETVKTEIAQNDAARTTLEATITQQQSNATEEQKQDFWKKELGEQ